MCNNIRSATAKSSSNVHSSDRIDPHSDGARVDALLGHAHVTANKNTCPGDKSALIPGGLRLGTPALTSRNFKEEDFRQVARFIDEGVNISLKAKARAGKTVKKFKALIETDEEIVADIQELGDRVVKFAKEFPFPGNHDDI